MQTTIITTETGKRLLYGKGNGKSVLDDSDLLLYTSPITLQEKQKDLHDLLDEMDSFRQKQRQASRFNTPYGFLRRLERDDSQVAKQPCAFVFKCKKEICAVLYTTIGYKRSINTLGPLSLHSLKLKILDIGFQALVYDKKKDTLHNITYYLAKLINSEIVDLMKWAEVDVESNLYESLISEIFSNCVINETQKVRWQTRLIDPDTGKLLQYCSGKTKKKLRKKDRDLAKYFKGDVEVRVIKDTSQVDGFIKDASAIVSQTYQAALNIGISESDEAQRNYLHELANDGYFRGYLLVANREAIAYKQGDLQSNVFYSWGTSYLPQYSRLSTGTVLTYRVINSLIEEEAEKIDYGWGDSAKKQEFGNYRIDESDIYVYSKKFAPLLAYFVDGLFIKAHRILWRMRSSGKFNKVRRIRRSILRGQKKGF